MPQQVLFNSQIENTPSTLLGDERSDLLESLRIGINAMQSPLPGNFGGLVANVATNQRFDIQQTDMNGVEGILSGW